MKHLIKLTVALIAIVAALVLFSFMTYQSPIHDDKNATKITPNETANKTANETIETMPNTVKIEGNAFNPQSMTVKTGTTIHWINKDMAQHQIISDDGSFRSPILKPGERYDFYFAQHGVFGYHCNLNIHHEKGRIIVQN